MKADSLSRRLATLEARQPPIKSDTQKFLEKLTDDELYQLGAIVETKECGGEPTSEEFAFFDGLRVKWDCPTD